MIFGRGKMNLSTDMFGHNILPTRDLGIFGFVWQKTPERRLCRTPPPGTSVARLQIQAFCLLTFRKDGAAILFVFGCPCLRVPCSTKHSGSLTEPSGNASLKSEYVTDFRYAP
jgi:hypothetical protein